MLEDFTQGIGPLVTLNRRQALSNPAAMRLGYWAATLVEIQESKVSFALEPVSISELEKIYHWSTEWYLKLLPKFRKALAEVVDETELNEAGWEILIGWWLAASLDVILTRYYESTKALVKYSSIQFTPIEWTGFIRDISELGHLFNDEIFNAWLHSFFLAQKITDDIPDSREVRHPRDPLLGEVVDYCAFVEKGKRVVLSQAISRLERIKLCFLTRRWPRRWKSVKPTKVAYDKTLREQVSKLITTECIFEDNLVQLLLRLLPLSYLESFGNYKEIVSENIKNQEFIFIGQVEMMFDDSYKYAVALAKSRSNSTIIAQQHGGAYGISKFHRGQFIEPRCCDHWLSFGWTGENITYSVKSSLLRRFRRRVSANPDGDILCVINVYPRYTYYLAALPQGPLVANWIMQIVDVIKTVANMSGMPVRMRTFGDLYDWGYLELLSNYGSIISIEHSSDVSISKSVSMARLVISCTNGTNLLELMCANVPTIIILDPCFWPLSVDGFNIFSQLMDVGVLHLSASSAIRKINEVRAHPNNWWQGREIQNARVEFCKIYANT